ncbi:uncharacterized protein [Periplaneta americana]|uniref:uncharacterized protein n=1 Tax=Periplaneta americana TaxID=6978 RepID=UPI0037E83404
MHGHDRTLRRVEDSKLITYLTELSGACRNLELPGSELRAPELPLLVRLLQAIGYELDSLNIFAGVSGQGAHAPYTVTITCAQSGLQAVLKSAAPSESEGCVVKQEPKEEMHMIASSLLPVVTPGMDRVTRDVVFQLLAFMCRTESGPRDAQRIWTGSSEPRNPRRTSTDSALHDIQMDTQDMMTSMAGSNEARIWGRV